MKKECNICYNELKKVSFMFSLYLKYFFKYLGICKNCNHLQIYNKFSEDEYKRINDKFFVNTYLSQDKNKKNEIIYQKRLEKFKNLISDLKINDLNILDFGAGQGFFAKYLIELSNKYYFTESNLFSIDKLKKIGGIHLESSFSNIKDAENYNNFFDLIILRHTLEHFLYPNDWLIKLKKILKDNGKIYCIVPNCSNINELKMKAGFRTDFLRPVHISYFNEENFENIFLSNGFKILKKNKNGELFILAENSNNNQTINYNNNNLRYMKIIKVTNNRHLIKDLKNIVLSIIKYFIKKILK